ncbi:hypothetical protein Tco_0819669 [Tanacetum coccineum]|uniref:Uncharacterized protein n=1 Tax=Tanacetum coccineum TaxID=301880 RepID=A0ABQ5A778_9ASTR
MHNNIMANVSRGHPPMLTTRRYAQWQSHFLRYINTRLNGDALRKCILKGKEISKLITPLSESASEEDSDPKQAQRDKDMQKNMALVAKYFKNIYKPTSNNLRTSSNSIRMWILLQAKKGVPLQAEQADWLEDTDEEVNEQELEAHYIYMAKIQEVPTADSESDIASHP